MSEPYNCGCVAGMCRAIAKADWAKPSNCRAQRFAGLTQTFEIDNMGACFDIVRDAWDRLSWRHAGFGALQAYIHEGETDELRVHIWHPDLVKPGIADSGLCHDHRFDMRSRVLVGELIQRECVLEERFDGDWETWEVLHARAAKALNGETFHQDPERTGARYKRFARDIIVPAGDGYNFPKREFHESHAKGLTITLVEKLRQEAFNARILAPYGRDIVHAFSNALPSDGAVVAAVLAQARAAIDAGPSQPIDRSGA